MLTEVCILMAMKTTRVLTLLLLAIASLSFGQIGLKELHPIHVSQPDLSNANEQGLDRFWELFSKESPSEAEKEELELLYEDFDETMESIWDVVSGGCNWYCGGGNYKVNASSELKSDSYISYSATSANDLNYKTAWVEGVEGAGIGEYLEYHFKNKSPKVTHIIVSNGYLKSDKAWKNNNRVKSLKVYINGLEYGVLQLEDSKTDQHFKFNGFKYNSDGKTDLVLKFEILEVYKGAKYDDTVITEIYFDGIGVH